MVRAQSKLNPKALKGRGAADNPANRFERLSWVEDSEVGDEEAVAADPTQFFKDHSKTILSKNDSPDLGFNYSINPYRGCEHGCIYCYARPYHEYLGMSAGLDFESRILVKGRAPELLRKELLKKRWRPQVIALSGATDCYQPVERRLKLTRACLEVLREFQNPVGVVTKNALVTRDLDLLKEMATYGGVAVYISVTTLDRELARIMEPRTSTPQDRLRAIRELSEAGIPTGVLVAPVVPAITDMEMPAILQAARQAGATTAAYIMLRLAHGLKELFSGWLDRHYPERKKKVLHRIEAIRGGRLNDPEFKTRMKGEGLFAEQVQKVFELHCRRLNLHRGGPDLNVQAFRTPGQAQLSLGI